MGICELLNTSFLGIENSGTFVSYLLVAMPVFNSFLCQVQLCCKKIYAHLVVEFKIHIKPLLKHIVFKKK